MTARASETEPRSRPRAEVSGVPLWQVARTFLSIGLGSFSLAALSEAKEHVTRKRGWFTDEEFMQGLGLAQLLPGAPTVNLASYLGYRLRGLPGAAAAAVSFLLPCFVLMLLLSDLYLRHGGIPLLAALFRGLAALVVGLVLNAVLTLWRSGVKTPFEAVMAFTGFALVFWLRLGVIPILLVAAGSCVLVILLTRRFPALSRWTGRRAAGDARGPCAEPREPRSSPASAGAPEVAPDRRGAGRFARLVAALALVLAIDLLLIQLRPELLQMGSRFLRIGALVFGSGYAMLPFIQDEVVTRSSWLTNEQFAVALALSLVTPGPVTIIGAFIGYKVAGVVGAVVGVVNMYFPAWAMTTVVAGPYARAGNGAHVRQVTQGVVAAFIGTLFVVLIRLASETLLGAPAVALAAGAFAARRYAKIHPIGIVLAGAAVSLVAFGVG
jgi:chromate transporter